MCGFTGGFQGRGIISGEIASPAHNLPPVGTRFVGRADELAAARRLIDAGERLLTITGPGGIGKTRFSLELARSLVGELTGGCWLIDLTEVDGGAGLHAAAARALPSAGEGAADPAEIGRRIAALGRALVLVDNCEQVVEEVARAVTGWLGDAPEVIFVATSRERLRLSPEAVLELGPLAVEEAAELFVDRASRQGGEWAARMEDDATAQIVDRLDGMPLAIELAAARVGLLEPRELLERLERRLDLLARGRRGDDARHQTLRATVDWSWELLDRDERAALAQLSVCRGGFDLAAAEALIDGVDAPVIDLVQSLRDKSLVRAAPTAAGHRLTLYRSIRDYAAERAAELAVRDGAQARHGAHYAGLAAELADAVDSRGAADAFARLEIEQDNLVAVIDRGMTGAVPLAHAVSAGLALAPIRTARGPLSDYTAVMDSLIASPGFASLPSSARARSHLARGRARELAGQLADASDDYRIALELAGEAGDARSQNRLLLRMGVLAVNDERFAEARDHYEVAYLLAQKMGDQLTEGRALSNLGVVCSETGDYAAARDYFDQARAIYRDLGDRRREAVVLGNLANVLQDEGKRDEARWQLERASETLEALGDHRTAAIFGAVIGTIDHEEGDHAAAVARYRGSAERLGQVGDRTIEGVLFGYASAAAAGAGDIETAEAELARARSLLADAGDRAALAALEVHAAHLDLARARVAEPARAADLRARVDAAIAAATPADRPPPQKVRAALRLLVRDLEADRRRDEQLDLAPDGSWFRPPGGDRVDLSRRHNLRRIVAALATGDTLTAADLFAAGWPGERAQAAAATNRVRVAVATLRKLGLRDHLVTRDDGYALRRGRS